MDDTDLNVSLSLEEFERRVQPLLARLEAPITQAMAGKRACVRLCRCRLPLLLEWALDDRRRPPHPNAPVPTNHT